MLQNLIILLNPIISDNVNDILIFMPHLKISQSKCEKFLEMSVLSAQTSDVIIQSTVDHNLIMFICAKSKVFSLGKSTIHVGESDTACKRLSHTAILL